MEENSRLMDDLKRQQSLYNELKKMRGRGEEIDMLQNVEQVPGSVISEIWGVRQKCWHKNFESKDSKMMM
jgi:hypothetical protein